MTINENELADARVAWGNGMISISKAYEKSGIDDATIVANEMLDQHRHRHLWHHGSRNRSHLLI